MKFSTMNSQTMNRKTLICNKSHFNVLNLNENATERLLNVLADLGLLDKNIGYMSRLFFITLNNSQIRQSGNSKSTTITLRKANIEEDKRDDAYIIKGCLI